jgi:GT2 family glycosyltransferase
MANAMQSSAVVKRQDRGVPLAQPQLFPYDERPRARGKFLFIGAQKYWVKGVTYGTFRPRANGTDYPSVAQLDSDFAAMADNGINTVRVYTVPPRELLDAAQRHGLRVMVGLPWEQHILFLDGDHPGNIEQRVREAARSCAGHPALLCLAIGNEIPPSIVRWYGKRRIEEFLHRLYHVVKSEDPQALVTYVNFPTTEYLELPFLDLFCFNVYLEQQERFEAYLARLQNLAGERPLLMAEIGLDSQRNGAAAQAQSLAWQIRSAFASGCAGAFIFAWTDEWWRGGFEIEDWDFGLVTRERQPKPALAAVRDGFAAVPFPADMPWPKVSVVICTYNGSRTIGDTLEALAHIEYPDVEVICVNDGSTDNVPQIVAEYPFVRLISTENRGLSAARNTGWQQATGEIVAYIDDDAYPDPHWLHYLAYTFMTTDFVGVGGPNIAPPNDGPIADCVYNAPGGPVHVLLSDREAEHIPGCNMAFRRDALAAIDGFDVRYRAAGDDVDVCWRLQENGGKIGFHAAAMDWHHRRNSVKMYWKQQQGYGKAEALLEEKWPQKYNAMGHLTWAGRLYGKGLTEALRARRWYIYGGSRGNAPFQSLYAPGPGLWSSLPLMPEWYLAIISLALISLLGLSWPPLLWAIPLLALAIAAPIGQAILSALRAEFPSQWPSAWQRAKLRALTALLHLMQPAARLKGRIVHGLTPWRRRIDTAPADPLPRTLTRWSETWRAPESWLDDIEQQLTAQRLPLRRGGDYDLWDLELRGGLFASMRLRLGVEEHGGGKQQLRFRLWPRFPVTATLATAILAGLGISALAAQAWIAGIGLTLAAGLLLARALQDAALATGVLRSAMDELPAFEVP